MLPEGALVPHWLIMRDMRVSTISDELWRSSNNKDEYTNRVFNYIMQNHVYALDEDAFGMAEYVQMPAEFFENGVGDCEEGGITMVTLSWMKMVPAFMVIGYHYTSSHRWPVVFYNGEWTVFDTVSGAIFPYADMEARGYQTLFEVGPFFARISAVPFTPFLPLP